MFNIAGWFCNCFLFSRNKLINKSISHVQCLAIGLLSQWKGSDCCSHAGSVWIVNFTHIIMKWFYRCVEVSTRYFPLPKSVNLAHNYLKNPEMQTSVTRPKYYKCKKKIARAIVWIVLLTKAYREVSMLFCFGFRLIFHYLLFQKGELTY